MFTRVVEITAKQGKSKELCNTIYEKVLPILTKHSGFVELTTLVSDTDPNRDECDCALPLETIVSARQGILRVPEFVDPLQIIGHRF